MDELTLGEKTYLSDIISKIPGYSADAYEIASNFTRLQRGKFLMHYGRKEYGEAKEMVENVKAFKTSLTK